MKNQFISHLLIVPAFLSLLAASVWAQTENVEQPQITTDGGKYAVAGSYKIEKRDENFAGRLEILRDARVDENVSVRQIKGEPPTVDTKDEQLKKTFEKEPLRPGVLRLSDESGKTIDSVTLECVRASVKRVFLYSPARPTYEVTCEYTRVEPYWGPETFFYDLKDGRLARLEAVDGKTGEKVPMSFVRSNRTEWTYDGARAKDILNIFTGWKDVGECDGYFIRYERYHFDGRRWVSYRRPLIGEYWDDKRGFPDISVFPKAQ